MNHEESTRIQRVLALMSIGMVAALRESLISVDESQYLLFAPYALDVADELDGSGKLHQLIEAGMQYEDIHTHLPHLANTKLDEIETAAKEVLRNTDPSNPELERLVRRLCRSDDNVPPTEFPSSSPG